MYIPLQCQRPDNGWVKLLCEQVHRGGRAASGGKSSLDLPLHLRIWPRHCLLGTKWHSPLSPCSKLDLKLFLHCFSGLDKYMHDPTTTQLETSNYPIWNIHFPGVTICPNTKVKIVYIKQSCYCSWQRASSRWHWKIQVSLGQNCWRLQMPR